MPKYTRSPCMKILQDSPEPLSSLHGWAGSTNCVHWSMRIVRTPTYKTNTELDGDQVLDFYWIAGFGRSPFFQVQFLACS